MKGIWVKCDEWQIGHGWKKVLLLFSIMRVMHMQSAHTLCANARPVESNMLEFYFHLFIFFIISYFFFGKISHDQCKWISSGKYMCMEDHSMCVYKIQ